MIGASKILTVSYGTFSCTLEGFDEPFNTMKAIAEYFRDLAAEDRYFGAEPPTPDAAMLHRIAEREIQRRVEAKIQDNGVILRAGDAEAPALTAPIAAPAVTAAAVDAIGESVAERLSRLRAAQTAPVTAEPAIQHTAEAAAIADDSYSEDQHSDDILANIAALAAPEAVVEAAASEPQYDIESNDLIAAEITHDQKDASEAEIAAEDLADLAALDAAPLDAAVPAEAADTSAALPVAAEGYDEDPALQTENSAGLAAAFADDLPAAENLGAVENLIATESLIAVEDPVIEDFAAAMQDAPAAEDYDDEILADLLPENDPVAAAQADADEDMLASLGALIVENDQIQPETAAPAHVSEPLIEASDALPEDTLPETVDAAEDDAEDDLLIASLPIAAEAPVEITAEVSAGPEIQPEPAAAAAAAAAANAFPESVQEPSEKIQRARARVIKIRRADAPRAPEAAPVVPQSSLLSPEAEAALQAELAALEAEVPVASAQVRPTRPVRHLTPRPVETSLDDDDHLAAALADLPAEIEAILPEITPEADAVAALLASHAPAEAETPEETEPELQPPHHAEGRKLLETESDDDAVNRLMAATNSVMDDEESRRRHSAISHLKAAVAATEAERQIKAANPGRPLPDRQDIYRHDLESVVRPAPADSSIEARAAANAERLTPLVLVSEQRIDRAKPAPAPFVAPVILPTAAPATPRVVMPVRPRRVGGAASMAAMQAMPDQDSLIGDADDLDDDMLAAEDEENFFVEGQNFADFAEKLGANSLADLLEASAVYCTQVLGRPNFSRPLVIGQLDTLIDQPDHAREDRLRAFGTLLRQGRIAKIKRGQFAMTERSPLLAEALRITA